jgi:hypothetical protein
MHFSSSKRHPYRQQTQMGHQHKMIEQNSIFIQAHMTLADIIQYTTTRGTPGFLSYFPFTPLSCTSILEPDFDLVKKYSLDFILLQIEKM